MRILLLTLTGFFLTACVQSEITQTDKDRLLTVDDLVSLGCKSTQTSDLEFETNGLKGLSKAVKVTYDGHNKCGFYLYIELTEVKVQFMSEHLARQNYNATITGLYFADLKMRPPKQQHAGLSGKYMEAYDEKGEYLGIIYSTEKNARIMTAMIFNKEKKHQPVFLNLLKLIEKRNLDEEQTSPKDKPFFPDSYVMYEPAIEITG